MPTKNTQQNRIIKFRAWDTEVKMFIVPFTLELLASGEFIAEAEIKNLIFMQFTGLKDKKGVAEVYEGDIIDEQGIIVGNIYESPQILKKGNLITITNMGTDTWRISESVAMGRGCRYA